MKDLRDPKILGEELLSLAKLAKGVPLSAVYDRHVHALEACPDYDANPSPLEKYGRPQDLPSTLPN